MTEIFIRNCWYVAATAPELGQSLLGRTLLDQPVVMYRREDGTAVALKDRCAHRFLPLSQGYRVGDRVQCGYHGMEYDCTGTCVHVPGQKSIPKGSDIRSFPLVENRNSSGYGSATPPLPMKASYPTSGATKTPDGPASSAIRCI